MAEQEERALNRKPLGTHRVSRGLELLARFVCIRTRECVRIMVLPPGRRQAALIRAAFDHSNLSAHIKRPTPEGVGLFMELLARFELATSSLPRVEGLRPSVVALPAEPKPCYINGFSFLPIGEAYPFM